MILIQGIEVELVPQILDLQSLVSRSLPAGKLCTLRFSLCQLQVDPDLLVLFLLERPFLQ